MQHLYTNIIELDVTSPKIQYKNVNIESKGVFI